MTDVKEAASRAAEFATALLGKDRTTGLQLEEVELGKYEGQEAWNITLSMIRPNRFDPTVFSSNQRDYKTFTVSRETGEVLSMRIRELSTAE